jgi:hypothetical protein
MAFSDRGETRKKAGHTRDVAVMPYCRQSSSNKGDIKNIGIYQVLFASAIYLHLLTERSIIERRAEHFFPFVWGGSRALVLD